MRKWTPATWLHDGRLHDAPAPGAVPAAAMAQMIDGLGESGFAARLLRHLHPLLPAASWSVYRVGPGRVPCMYLSASLDIPDTTRACWSAYLSGPHRHDRSLGFDAEAAGPAHRSRGARGAQGARGGPGAPGTEAMPGTQLCHITAQEVPPEHRARVYEAHGVAERVSVVAHGQDETLFAVNFYRHVHQHALTDAQIAAFEQLAPALLALARKHVALRGGHADADADAPAQSAVALPDPDTLRQRLLQCDAALTARELDVCSRLLRGMTHDGIAADLGLSAPTVKTYRNRAFARLGIHFRNELFARVLPQR